MKINRLLSDEFKGAELLSCLESLDDPRIDRKKLYPLREVLLVALCAMLCCCEGFRAFSIFGKEKIDFLRRSIRFLMASHHMILLPGFFH